MANRTRARQRRARNGDGGVVQVHNRACPPPVDGKRPEHQCHGPWVARIPVTGPDGKVRRESMRGKGGTQKEAYECLRELRRRRDIGIRRPRNYTLSEWVAEYLVIKADEVRPTTVEEYQRTARYIDSTIGGIPLEQVQPADVRTLNRELTKRGLRGTTRNHAHSLLRAALNRAVEERLIEWNPASVVKAPHLDVQHATQPTEAELAAIRGAVSGVRELARLAVACLALRPAEVLSLEWHEIHEDAEPPYLQVGGSMRAVKGVGLVKFDPKTDRSAAPVPLPRWVAEALRMWRIESGGEGYVFCRPGHPDVPTRSERDYRWWKDLLQRAGVRPDIDRYGMRGFVASAFDRSGASPRVTSDALRHAKVSTTMEHYAQTIEPQMAGAFEAVIGRFGEPLDELDAPEHS